MSAVSRAESVENQQRLALETAEQQQKNATYGTAAGVGGMIGANKMMASSEAATAGVESINTALQGYGTASQSLTGGVQFTPVGGETLVGDAAISSMNQAAGIIDGVAAEQLAMQSSQTVGALANATPVAEAVPVAGEALTAVKAGTTAVQGGGAMAQLATMATPIAIGLGVAFLLNKLFD
jgi:hypothetical protein